jgi:hypothetical protein
MTDDLERHVGRRVLEQLQDGRLHPAFVEQSQIGYVMLALLERIERLEVLALLVESQKQPIDAPAAPVSGVLPDGGT